MKDNERLPGERDDMARAFGARVRRLRETGEMSLERFAALSGVSRAMLSKVERGERSPTIGVASRISHALDVPLSELMGIEAAEQAVAILRRDDRLIFRDPETGFERHVVSPVSGASRTELLYHYLPSFASTGTLPSYGPGVEKQLVIIEGELNAVIDGKSQFLRAGDAMLFQAGVEHIFTNPSADPCGYFLIVSRTA